MSTSEQATAEKQTTRKPRAARPKAPPKPRAPRPKAPPKPVVVDPEVNGVKLTGTARLLLWRLAFAPEGGQFGPAIKPAVTAAILTQLQASGLLAVEQRKNPESNRAAKYLQLTGAGWAWLGANTHVPFGDARPPA